MLAQPPKFPTTLLKWFLQGHTPSMCNFNVFLLVNITRTFVRLSRPSLHSLICWHQCLLSARPLLCISLVSASESPCGFGPGPLLSGLCLWTIFVTHLAPHVIFLLIEPKFIVLLSTRLVLGVTCTCLVRSSNSAWPKSNSSSTCPNLTFLLCFLPP